MAVTLKAGDFGGGFACDLTFCGGLAAWWRCRDVAADLRCGGASTRRYLHCRDAGRWGRLGGGRGLERFAKTPKVC
jgi:hypothetical protein